jgi:hypothetical protein
MTRREWGLVAAPTSAVKRKRTRFVRGWRGWGSRWVSRRLLLTFDAELPFVVLFGEASAGGAEFDEA